MKITKYILFVVGAMVLAFILSLFIDSVKLPFDMIIVSDNEAREDFSLHENSQPHFNVYKTRSIVKTQLKTSNNEELINYYRYDDIIFAVADADSKYLLLSASANEKEFKVITELSFAPAEIAFFSNHLALVEYIQKDNKRCSTIYDLDLTTLKIRTIARDNNGFSSVFSDGMTIVFNLHSDETDTSYYQIWYKYSDYAYSEIIELNYSDIVCGYQDNSLIVVFAGDLSAIFRLNVQTKEKTVFAALPECRARPTKVFFSSNRDKFFLLVPSYKEAEQLFFCDIKTGKSYNIFYSLSYLVNGDALYYARAIWFD